MSKPTVNVDFDKFVEMESEIEQLRKELKDLESRERALDSIEKDLEIKVFPMAKDMFKEFLEAYFRELGIDGADCTVKFKDEGLVYDEWRYGDASCKAKNLDVNIAMEVSKHWKGFTVYFSKIIEL